MQKCKIKSLKCVGKQKTYNVTMKSHQHNYKIIDGSGYGIFTKNSHSAAYAYLAYQTAWLKCFFRPEFMCALLSSVISEQKKEQRAKYEKSLQQFGLVLLPYDINLSKKTYTLEKDGIRPPLAALKGIGNVALDNVIARQPYDSLQHFAEKHSVDSGVHKAVVSTLLEAGCMQRWGTNKEKMLAEFEAYKDAAKKKALQIKKKEIEDKKFTGSLF